MVRIRSLIWILVNLEMASFPGAPQSFWGQLVMRPEFEHYKDTNVSKSFLIPFLKQPVMSRTLPTFIFSRDFSTCPEDLPPALNTATIVLSQCPQGTGLGRHFEALHCREFGLWESLLTTTSPGLVLAPRSPHHSIHYYFLTHGGRAVGSLCWPGSCRISCSGIWA